MNSDIPKVPPKPQYVYETTFNAGSGNSNANKPVGSEIPEPHPVGLIFYGVTGGTVASGVSQSTVPSVEITYIPPEGPIPYFEVQKQYVNEFSELIVNPTKK